MHVSLRTISTGVVALIAAVPMSAQDAGVPTNTAAVSRACDAAGGIEALRRLELLEVRINSEEVTQDGHVSNLTKNLFFAPPGPVPARLELPDRQVVAGDDGTGGWAVLDRVADSRPTTIYMVRRSITTYLFPVLLPFSLNWDGVAVTRVAAATAKGQAVWRLTVVMSRDFFDTPQVATTWTVDLDRQSFAVVRADSPGTDLGKGLVADGMRFTWRGTVKLGEMTFFGEQRVTGLDEAGQEKVHSRTDHLQYRRLPASETQRLFANPIPPENRPKPPAPQPPRDLGANPKS